MWTVSSTIQIPDDVTLLLMTNAFIVAADNLDDPVLMNAAADSGDSTRNSDIAIVSHGGTIHQNGANQDDTLDSWREQTLHFHKVDGLTVTGPLHLSESNGYGIGAEDVTDFELGQLHCDLKQSRGDQDMINIGGPAHEGDIHHVYGASDDGSITLGSANTALARGSGAISNVAVHNIYLDNGYRILHLYYDDSNTIEGVEARNLHGRNMNFSPLVQFGSAGATNTASCRNVLVDGVYSDGSQQTVEFHDPASDIRLANLNDPDGSGLIYSDGPNVDDLTIRDCTLKWGGGNPVGIIHFQEGAVIDGVRMQGCHLIGGGSADGGVGLGIEDSNTEIHDAVIEGNRFESTQTAVNLGSSITASNVRLRDNTFTSIGTDRSLGVTAGVTVGGRGEEAVGSSGTPTASNWEAGDIVENTSPSPTEVYQLRPDGTWKQLA